MTTAHTSVEVFDSVVRSCDFCGKDAHYDGKTVYGPWANMCPDCFDANGCGLGLGQGQKLIYVNVS